ncbi:hypothetical protein [Sinomonas mesophila]|uniref:hypothetical protein n=1 Tax=Sinomonas mesophila TaxID=1531955 RepID=UPI0009843B6E|nr:hypothetical protein [Sinomonas mesophila]
MRKQALVALMSLLALTSCAAPASSTTAPAAEEHETDEHYPDVPVVTWDAASERSALDTAAKAMTLFARPGVEQRQWITDLAPLLAEEYATEAQYINPARVPVTAVTGDPVLTREAGNPMTATATFATNAGKWTVLIHRTGQADPWRVVSIAPKSA